jgi:sodium-dependent dicarboxylate transporter 2/3/5
MAARVGLLAGPLAALLTWILLSGADLSMPPAARATAAVSVLMAIWWMTEAIPLAATALLPLVLFPLTGVYLAGLQQGDAVVVRQDETGQMAEGTVVSFDEKQVTVKTDRGSQQYLPGELQVLEKERPIQRAASPYASRFVFILMGGFMIALGIQRWGLHRRIALMTVLFVGTQPRRLIAGFMLATAGLSMWISNTATTAMMLPIAISVVALLRGSFKRAPGEETDPAGNFASCLMLAVAYSASIGGLGTLIGTPTNLFMASVLEDAGQPVSFGLWMLIAMPLVIVLLFICWWYLTRIALPIGVEKIPGGRELIRGQLVSLGSMSRGEWTVLVVFLGTALAWMFRRPLTEWTWLVDRLPIVGRLDDSIIAMAGALSMFIIPVNWKDRVFALDWEGVRDLPWGVLLLFGGGLSLAAAVNSSGLGQAICQLVVDASFGSTLLLVMISTVMVIFLTELASNTAAASLTLPILAAAAAAFSPDPSLVWLVVIPAGMASSCAFMLPVATPPNAIVFASGELRISQMVKAGIGLNLMAIIVIPLYIWLLVSQLGVTGG